MQTGVQTYSSWQCFHAQPGGASWTPQRYSAPMGTAMPEATLARAISVSIRVRSSASSATRVTKPSVYKTRSAMQLGYMRVSKADGRQGLDLQRDALLTAGVRPQHLYVDLGLGPARGPPRPGRLPQGAPCGGCAGRLAARPLRPRSAASDQYGARPHHPRHWSQGAYRARGGARHHDGRWETRLRDLALVGFQGLMLIGVSETRNAFTRLLKNKDFKEDAGRTHRVVRHGDVHAPGIQHEPCRQT